MNSHFFLKVLCLAWPSCFLPFVLTCSNFQKTFSLFNKPKMFFNVKNDPHPILPLCATFTAGCRVVRWGGGRKVSRLSITQLSECYLCQTPTILSRDTETASRTSGRHGKHSRIPREVWQRQWIQPAQMTERSCLPSQARIHAHRKRTQRHGNYT